MRFDRGRSHMVIEKAGTDQYQSVRAFYHAVIDAVGESRDSVGWKKDIYPAPAFLNDAIRRGELYVALEGAMIVGAMVLTHQYNDEYRKLSWPTQAEDTEVTIIHALGVHPSRRGRGYAGQMLRFAVEHAREGRQKALRIDVLKGNAAAKRLYLGTGFRYVHTLPMFYEDTGRTEFDLYEYPL